MRIRISVDAIVVAAIFILCTQGANAQGAYPVGSKVQASPLQMDGYWQECTVLSGPDASQSYQLKCGKFEMSVPGKWVRSAGTPSALKPAPAEPAEPKTPPPTKAPSAPVIQDKDKAPRPTAPAAAPPTIPAPPPPAPNPPPQSAGSGGVALGAYECWAYSRPRLLLNFKVIGAGRYTASDGSAGTFTFDPASKAIRFTGYLADSMPDGFSSIYHEPHGKPTVSFRGRSGFETSFCEKAK